MVMRHVRDLCLAMVSFPSERQRLEPRAACNKMDTEAALVHRTCGAICVSVIGKEVCRLLKVWKIHWGGIEWQRQW